MTILVTGATGNIGRKVVGRLVAAGVPAEQVRALTNNPGKADLPDGVQVATGFIGAPQTLDGVFDGVDAMYLAPYERTAAQVLRRAADADVGYVVALSGGAHWQGLTDTINASALPVTHLGPGEFLENFAGWAQQIAHDGVVREPYPDAGNAPIGMDDIANVAAALLTAEPAQRPQHLGKMYEITGPEFLTRPQAVAAVGEGIGRELRFEQISRDEAEQHLARTMGDYAAWYLDLLKASQTQRQEPNNLVQELTGMPAISLAEWARENRTIFGA